jgi:hypothetical protein
VLIMGGNAKNEKCMLGYGAGYTPIGPSTNGKISTKFMELSLRLLRNFPVKPGDAPRAPGKADKYRLLKGWTL